MEIYIIRHTPVAVDKGICYGQSNVALDDSFLSYLEKYKSKLPESFDAVYSSPLERCLKLANHFSENVIKDDRLMEMNFGNWELKNWNEIPREESEPWTQEIDTIAVPNGESFLVLYQRMIHFYEDLKKQDFKQVLVVTHAGPIRSFWAKILELKLINAFKIPVGFGEVLIINSEFETIVQKA